MTNIWLGRGGVMKGWGLGKIVDLVVFSPKRVSKDVGESEMHFD